MQTINREQLYEAHDAACDHKDLIEASEICGCYHCRHTFPPEKIKKWTDKKDGGGQTALCPLCGLDAVIGSACGFSITPEFLREMNRYWFGGKV